MAFLRVRVVNGDAVGKSRMKGGEWGVIVGKGVGWNYIGIVFKRTRWF